MSTSPLVPDARGLVRAVRAWQQLVGPQGIEDR